MGLAVSSQIVVASTPIVVQSSAPMAEITADDIRIIRLALELSHETLRRNALLDYKIKDAECGDVLRDALRLRHFSTPPLNVMPDDLVPPAITTSASKFGVAVEGKAFVP